MRLPTILASFLAVAAASTALGSASASAAAPTTSVTFPFEDARRLRGSEKNGGLAYLTDGVTDDGPVPLVVYLHGLNDFGPVHYWYGLYNNDLRSVADAIVAMGEVRPFVLAAPSQTRDASNPWRMWDGFDLDAFVDATEAALPEGIEIDRDAVIVVGHSGAGCNLTGGLLATLSPTLRTVPAAWLAVDTCFDSTIGRRLGAAPAGTSVWAYYQPNTWTRDFDAFRAAFVDELGREPGREGHFSLETKLGPDPHNTILERAMRDALPKLLPKETPEPYE
jgi:hypothetical protein